MTDDLFADDDLFAVRPAPTRVKSRPKPPEAMPLALSGKTDPIICVSGPVASYACRCGFRDEVKEPAPAYLDCGLCHGLETLRRIVPRFTPPADAGRQLTADERRAIALDKR